LGGNLVYAEPAPMEGTLGRVQAGTACSTPLPVFRDGWGGLASPNMQQGGGGVRICQTRPEELELERAPICHFRAPGTPTLNTLVTLATLMRMEVWKSQQTFRGDIKKRHGRNHISHTTCLDWPFWEVGAWLSRRRFQTDGRTIGRWPRGRP
jgi:hypothetical protein